MAPLAENPKPIILLVFFKQNAFPQELPYENHFGTGGSVTIMILLWRFRDHNGFALEIIFTNMILHVQGSSWRHFVPSTVTGAPGLPAPGLGRVCFLWPGFGQGVRPPLRLWDMHAPSTSGLAKGRLPCRGPGRGMPSLAPVWARYVSYGRGWQARAVIFRSLMPLSRNH